jgi:hypothetical protein
LARAEKSGNYCPVSASKYWHKNPTKGEESEGFEVSPILQGKKGKKPRLSLKSLLSKVDDEHDPGAIVLAAQN